MTIAVLARRVRERSRHYAHIDCPGHADYIEEHDHRGRPDGRGDPGGLRRRRPDAADPRAHPLARQVGVPALVVFLNKIDLVDDEELLELVEIELRELLTHYKFPGDEIPITRRCSRPAYEKPDRSRRGAADRRPRSRSMDEYIPEPVRAIDKPFLMPIEDVFSIKGARHRSAPARSSADRSRSATRSRSSASNTNKNSVVTGVEMFQKTMDYGQAGDNVGVLLARR